PRMLLAVGGRLPPEVFNRKMLTLEDAQAIEQLSLVKAVAPLVQFYGPEALANSITVRYRDRTARNTIVQGVTPQAEIVMNLQLTTGRCVNDADHSHKSNVVVLGHDTAETIFPANVDPIGKEFHIQGNVFRVIGVVAKRKDALTPGANPNDNVAEMPIGTFWRLHPEQQDFMFVVGPIFQEAMPRAMEQIEQLMRIRRGVPANKDSDFAVSSQDTFTDLWKQISSGIFTVMLAI